MSHFFLILTSVFSLILSCGISQNKEEFEIHLKSIDSTFSPGYEIDNFDSLFNNNRRFVDYVIENVIKNKEDKYFISNRNILRKLQVQSCDDEQAVIKDTLNDGSTCKIVFTVSKFNPDDYDIELENDEDYKRIALINGIFPIGNYYQMGEPDETIVSDISIMVDEKEVEIPDSAFSFYFNPTMCTPKEDSIGGHFDRPVEAYNSLDGNYIYLYTYGCLIGGCYFAKLIFDREKYITSMFVDRVDLIITRSYRKDFIGF